MFSKSLQSIEKPLSVLFESLSDFNCHTIILYGSRARGDNSYNSDIDVVAITDKKIRTPNCAVINGFFIDCLIVDLESIYSDFNFFFRLAEGIVLFEDKRKIGTNLIMLLKQKLSNYSVVITKAELNQRLIWLKKTYQNSDGNDIFSILKKISLLHQLLPLYFEINNLLYQGHKKSVNYLKENDSFFLQIYESALYNDKDLDNCVQYLEVQLKNKIINFSNT